MTMPNPDALKTARTRIAMAEEQLQIACTALRRQGWPENADALAVELKRLRIWTQDGGFLDCMAREAIEVAADDAEGTP